MFKISFRKKKNETESLEGLIKNLYNHMDLRFNEVKAQIKDLEHGLAQMETKLLSKDLKDKQAYGLLHYKLHEAKNAKLDDEIKELEQQLRKTRLQKDN